MAGNVYVFNATPNQMALLLNNHILDASVSGVQQASNYQPSPIEVARNPSPDNPGNATFGGKNTLVVSFPSGSDQTYPVNISSNTIPIDDDVQLYIFFDEVVLVSPTGAGTSSVNEGEALTGTDADEVKRKLAAA